MTATLTIHTGRTVENITGKELHPVNAVLLAKKIFDTTIKSDKNLVFHTNSTDFVSAISALAEANRVPIEYYIDGVKGDIEKVFEDFNKALDIINEFSQNK